MGLRGFNKISNQRQAILLALAFTLNSSGLMETHWNGHNRNKDEQIHGELNEKKKVHMNKENIQFHITILYYCNMCAYVGEWILKTFLRLKSDEWFFFAFEFAIAEHAYRRQ